MATTVEAPIFVIGTHRSGTTLLGGALGHHPDVAYWEEPRHVWSWGNNYKRHDRLTADDARPRIRRHVRSRFARFLEASGRDRFAEKTPSNCLRLPFLDEIFPDALFVHIYRDGRAVLHSTDVVTRTRLPESRWYGRRLFGTPIWEWPALLPRAWRTLGRRLLGREMKFWGPQPPDWHDWLKDGSRLEVLAKQWRHTLEPVLEFRDQLRERHRDRWLDVRYEDLVREPARRAREIESFCRLNPSQDFVDHLVRECHQDSVDAWRARLPVESLGDIRPILEPILQRLGYAW